MCGIAGFFGEGDKAVLERMTNRLYHRGPDDSGLLVDEGRRAYLGHRRLAILDIAGGRQPMETDDGEFVIVFNGEIYNFAELRSELVACGASFRSDHSDTEVLLHGYRQWGESLPDRLNGMWAFAIHDRKRRRVFLSRDRFGKKPLFYRAATNVFVFASELNSLREHPSVPAGIDPLAIQKYFAYGFVPAPSTWLSGCAKLPAGHSLTLDLDTMVARTRCYWSYQPEPFEQIPPDAEQAWGDELLHRLDQAVQRRMVADVPVGVFLSGGIDSSLIAALAMRHVGNSRLKAFSIGFKEAGFDETAHARLIAERIGADHQIEMLSVGRALELMPTLIPRLDEPIADASILPTYLLCKHARRQVTVALGGDGADELFAGYDPFRALRYAKWYSSTVPRPMHQAISMLAARMPVSHGYMSFDFKVKRTLAGLGYPSILQLPVWMAPLPPKELAELVGQPVTPEQLYSEAIEAWDACAIANPVDRAIAFYIRLYLQDGILVKVDRASMLNSLEVRAPFLDVDFVDFVRRIPSRYKLRNGRTKWLLKRVAESILPYEIVHRRKQGFAIPVGQWFATGQLPPPRHQPALNPAFWQRKLDGHVRGDADNRLYLWSDLMLSGMQAARSSRRHHAPLEPQAP